MGIEEIIKKMNSNILLQETFHNNLKTKQWNSLAWNWCYWLPWQCSELEKLTHLKTKMIAVKQVCRNVKRNPQPFLYFAIILFRVIIYKQEEFVLNQGNSIQKLTLSKFRFKIYRVPMTSTGKIYNLIQPLIPLQLNFYFLKNLWCCAGWWVKHVLSKTSWKTDVLLWLRTNVCNVCFSNLSGW